MKKEYYLEDGSCISFFCFPWQVKKGTQGKVYPYKNQIFKEYFYPSNQYKERDHELTKFSSDIIYFPTKLTYNKSGNFVGFCQERIFEKTTFYEQKKSDFVSNLCETERGLQKYGKEEHLFFSDLQFLYDGKIKVIDLGFTKFWPLISSKEIVEGNVRNFRAEIFSKITSPLSIGGQSRFAHLQKEYEVYLKSCSASSFFEETMKEEETVAEFQKRLERAFR